MNVEAAARRWAAVWSRAWPERDMEAITALYADGASYRALAFRDPDLGLRGVRRYLGENFAVEEEIACQFGQPIVSGDRAAVEWWGSWVERGERVTLAGVTVLRFDAREKVIDHRDYWNQVDRREPPYPGWRRFSSSGGPGSLPPPEGPRSMPPSPSSRGEGPLS